MADYTLYYWPLPFRGQFVRSVFAHAHATWDEAGIAAIRSLMGARPSDQPVPHMGPPVLSDHVADISLAQLETLGSTPQPLDGNIREDGWPDYPLRSSCEDEATGSTVMSSAAARSKRPSALCYEQPLFQRV